MTKSIKIPLAVAGLVLGGTAIIVISQHQSLTALRHENESLRQQLSHLNSAVESPTLRRTRTTDLHVPRLPAPSMPGVSASESGAEPSATNLVASVMRGEAVPRLTAAQLKRYLEENHRNADSLLSAYRTSGDPELLKEAMEKFPGDPQVAYEAALNKDLPPEERREWLEAFKKAAPENPLANYLSALDHFQSGQTDQAVSELIAASERPGFADYTVNRIKANEEAYRAAGYSETEAKMAATWGVTLPQLAKMRALGQNMVGLAESYRQSGDEASAQAALQIAMSLGTQLDRSSEGCVPLVNRLVGIAIQRMALNSMGPSNPYGNSTVQGALDQLVLRKNSIGDLVKSSTPLQNRMTSADWLNYNDRTVTFGEENAIRWVLNKYGKQ